MLTAPAALAARAVRGVGGGYADCCRVGKGFLVISRCGAEVRESGQSGINDVSAIAAFKARSLDQPYHLSTVYAFDRDCRGLLCPGISPSLAF